jgi:serine/threonine protein kinase
MTLEFPFYSENLKENIINGIKNKKILNEEGNNYNDIILKRYSQEFLDIINKMMTIDPEERPEIEDILQKKIVVERMESLLIESEFNFEKADIEIKKYQENEQRIIKLIKERLNKKEEQFDKETNYIIIEDINEKDIIEEKNENAILTQQINQLQNDRLKYNYLRQMSLIHIEKLRRIKTTSVNF